MCVNFFCFAANSNKLQWLTSGVLLSTMLETLPIADVFIVVITALMVVMVSTYISSSKRRKDQLPHVPYLVPYVGSILGFGTNPVQFIRNNYEKVFVHQIQ